MFIYIKTLGNATANDIELEVSPLDTIQDIKARLVEKLNIPISQQKLVLRGKPLHDGSIRDYQIVDGTKLHLIISNSSSITSPVKQTNNSLINELRALASKWTANPNERELFVTRFQTEMKTIVDQLSLDDIEKLCTDRVNSSS